MRARLMMKLMGIIVMLILTIVTAHSCNSSPASSPLNPNTLLQNGVSSLCANQAATAAAEGSDATPSLQMPSGNSSLAHMAQAAGVSPAALSCPTTTIAGP